MSESPTPYETPDGPSKEERILAAARCVFHRSGHSGARMQEIAEEAGVNQALLHYYFRSKDKLFHAVFEEDVFQLLQAQRQLLTSGGDLFAVIRAFVHQHISFLQAHPYLPGFVLGEIMQQPERLDAITEQKKVLGLLSAFSQLVEAAEAEGLIHPTDPSQLMTNLMALSMHPFIARPMIQRSHQLDDAAFERFVEERKNQLPEFIIRGIARNYPPEHS